MIVRIISTSLKLYIYGRTDKRSRHFYPWKIPRIWGLILTVIRNIQRCILPWDIITLKRPIIIVPAFWSNPFHCIWHFSAFSTAEPIMFVQISGIPQVTYDPRNSCYRYFIGCVKRRLGVSLEICKHLISGRLLKWAKPWDKNVTLPSTFLSYSVHVEQQIEETC